MDEKKLLEYEKIIDAFSSYKLDFMRIKVEGYHIPILVLSIIGIGFMTWGYLLDNLVGSVVMLFGALFFLSSFIPRLPINETQKNRDQVLDNMYKKGRFEWSMMEDYFLSRYNIEVVRDPKIFKSTIVTLIIGQFIVVLSNPWGNAITVLQFLLLMAVLHKTFAITRKTFFQSRRDTLELVLKETISYLKKHPWKSLETT